MISNWQLIQLKISNKSFRKSIVLAVLSGLSIILLYSRFPGHEAWFSFSLPKAQTAPINITRIYTVAPDVMALQIQVGQITRGQQTTYEKLPGDRLDNQGWIKRKGKTIGYLVDAEQALMRTLDQFEGPHLKDDWLENSHNYQISSPNHAAYRSPQKPTAVFHKVKPIGLAQVGPWNFAASANHTIYLKLPSPLATGVTYQIDGAGETLQDTSFTYNPQNTRSEAVHVSQLGFDPGDPVKVAFLSTWMEPGATIDYVPGTPFWVIDTQTHEKLYEGQIALSKSKDEHEDDRDRNYNATDVYILDFSDFHKTGHYQIWVDGIGTSFAFEISEKTWENAFYVSARGLYHQRSGIALKAPYTTYERPRPFHPNDGVKIYQSTVPLMDTSNGLNLAHVSAFEALVETKTEQLVPEAWGGWFDAGDWDRRIQHLQASRFLLELAASHPDYFDHLDLNLPESHNAIPDLVDEALWGLDIFRRLQTPAGGIPGGIESAGHPKTFETSWQESQTIMVYGPGLWSSYIYAGVAAQAAYFLRTYDPDLAQQYAHSAEQAMTWAEAEYTTYTGTPHIDIRNQRNLAAAELYRLTESARWHQLFLHTTVFRDPGVKIFESPETRQEDAAFVYALTPHNSINHSVQSHAIQALLQEADTQIAWIERTGFKWQKHPQAPIWWGTSLGFPNVTTQLRIHQLTGNLKYLKASLLATQFSAGANPDNMVYTTGLGQRHPRNPLIVDPRATGREPPPGITLYGFIDQPDPWNWVFNLFKESVSPWPTDWPTTEGYFDIYLYVPVTEFTIPQTIAPTSYAWGYLAAVDETNQGATSPVRLR